MAKIAIDLDSTLYDFEKVARDAFFEIAYERGDKSAFRGAYMPWVEWRSPSDVLGLDMWMEAITRAHDPEVIAQQLPFEGAVDVINELADAGHQLMYISGRNEQCHEATWNWLEDWGLITYHFLNSTSTERALEPPELICTFEDKQRYMRDCQYLIDDRPKTLVEFVYDRHWLGLAGEKRKAFGLMYEYNRALTDIPNVYLAPTWNGLRYYLADKGVLPKKSVEWTKTPS